MGSKKKRRKRKKYLDEIEKALRQKIVDIEKFLASEPKDLEKLQELATSDGGLMTDNYRRRCWPILAGIHLIESEILPTQEECEAHAQYNQVSELEADFDQSLDASLSLFRSYWMLIEV